MRMIRVALPYRVIIRHVVLLGALAFAARVTSAQQALSIRGQVFDSVASKPLAGAVVQIASPNTNAAPRDVTTDASGRYEIGGLAAGRYVIGFYHDALTALGLDAPSRSVDVGADAVTTVDLAIPSSEAIRALRCGPREPLRQGMLVGFVRDAESHGAVAGAQAIVQWRAMALDSANYHVVDESQRATIEPDGSVLVCGLPVDAPLDLRVNAPAHQAIEGSVVNVPVNGIGRLDLLLVDSAQTSGSAVIRGRVVRENGKAVGSGRVVIKSLARDVPIQDGAFSAGGLPSGSWIAEARVIGVEPQDVLVTASDSAVTATRITVGNGPQLLDAVTVIGKPSRSLRILDDVLRRSRIGTATTFLPGHPALKSALFAADPLREARGFQFINDTLVLGRAHGAGRCTAVAVYVDDMRVPEGFRNVDAIVPVNQILAIEAWPDIAFAPVQYRGPVGSSGGMMGSGASGRRAVVRPDPSPCALVLIWTKRPF